MHQSTVYIAELRGIEMGLNIVKTYMIQIHEAATSWPELEQDVEDARYIFRQQRGLLNKVYIFVDNQTTLQTLSDPIKSHRTDQSIVLKIINLIKDVREMNILRRTPMEIEFH